MSRLVSIECDPTEIRIAVGTSGLTGVSIEHVACTPLKLDDKEDLLGSQKTLEAIQALLKQLNVKSGNAIFCLGRSSIELRALTLPSVDRNELPDMVRFAAQRQFANVGDTWPIDFVTMPTNGQQTTTDCMAATIHPGVVERLNKIAESAGLTLTQVVLRPMTSATMAVAKKPELANYPTLMMELFGDEADMAVIDQGQVVFMRNVRFSQPISPAANLSVLVGEIKRTLIAAASQRANLDIQQIRIWGPQAQHALLCESLAKSLQVDVQSVDAFDLLDVSKTVRAEAGEQTGKFASSLGALLAPQFSDRLIDFSNPRKREEVKRPYLKYAIAGGVAATLLIGGYVWYSSAHSALDQEIVRLNGVINKNNESQKLYAKKLSDWSKVETFLQGDFQWLDELEYLSMHAANADRAVFGVTTFTTDPRTNSSAISTKFITAKQEDVPEFQEAFRDPQHAVRNTSVTKSQDKSGVFPWVADLTIKLAPLKVPDPRRSAAAKKPADKVPAETSAPSTPPAATETVSPSDKQPTEAEVKQPEVKQTEAGAPPSPNAEEPQTAPVPQQQPSPTTPSPSIPSPSIPSTEAPNTAPPSADIPAAPSTEKPSTPESKPVGVGA